MVMIVSGLVMVPSFILSCEEAIKELWRWRSRISGAFWIELFIYLFLRKVLADVAKKFQNLSRRLQITRDGTDGTRLETLERRNKETNRAKKAA